MMDHENDIKQNNIYMYKHLFLFLSEKFSQLHFLIIFSFYEIYLFSFLFMRIV